MASKSKTGGATKRPAKATLSKATQKTQRERFIEAARIAGVDETGKEFSRALAKLLPPRVGRS